ncbi:MAG: hypothetical protein V4448_01425 [Pseudomonadota bacterium]
MCMTRLTEATTSRYGLINWETLSADLASPRIKRQLKSIISQYFFSATRISSPFEKIMH